VQRKFGIPAEEHDEHENRFVEFSGTLQMVDAEKKNLENDDITRFGDFTHEVRAITSKSPKMSHDYNRSLQSFC